MGGRTILFVIVLVALALAMFLTGEPHKCTAGSVENLFTDCK